MGNICTVCDQEVERPLRRKMCDHCYNQQYYKANRTRILENVKRYKNENREQYRKTRRKIDRRRRANMTEEERQAVNRREWENRKCRMTEADWEKRRAYGRKYYQRNKERLAEQRRAAKQRRRARKKSAEATLTDKEWLYILKTFDYRCAYCGKRITNPTQDHIIPVANGGNYTIHNIVPACLKCNQKKSAGPPPVPVQPVLL